MQSFSDDILQSKPFVFIVGSDKTKYFLHTALVSKTSEPLSKLCNGPMKETKEGCALLEDIDSSTFARYGHFIYTGDYRAAEHTVALDATNIASSEGAEHADSPEETHIRNHEASIISGYEQAPDIEDRSSEVYSWGGFKSDKRKSGKKTASFWEEDIAEPEVTDDPSPSATSPQARAWEVFRSMKFELAGNTSPLSERANKEPCEGYTEVFLSHARVYVFADQYDIAELRQLALRKLHSTLVQFTLYDERVGDITALVQYAYYNTTDRSEGADSLRVLVTKYATCFIKEILKDDVFCKIMHAEGAFALDLVRNLVELYA